MTILTRYAAIALAASSLFASAATVMAGDDDHSSNLIVTTPVGSVSPSEGLGAWDRIHAVVSHPRCANCHVDESNIPMWSGPSYGETRPHGMNIDAGASRIGAEYLPCSTCHIESTAPNTTPHAAPHTGHVWLLAPVAFVWFGKDSPTICTQMRDPERNGGRDGDALIEHIVHDAEIEAFISWGFNPGGGREPAPGTMQQHLDDMVTWTAAGMPCPGDGTENVQ